jgi:hypothetical protein
MELGKNLFRGSAYLCFFRSRIKVITSSQSEELDNCEQPKGLPDMKQSIFLAYRLDGYERLKDAVNN